MDSQASQHRPDHRRIEREAANWLVRRNDGERTWSADDQAALDAWLAASTAHQVAYVRLDMVWQRGDRLKALAAGLSRGEVPAKGEWRHAASRWPQAGSLPRQPERAPDTTRDERDQHAAVADRDSAPLPREHLSGDALARLRFASRRTQQSPRRGVLLGGIIAASVCLAAAGLGWMHVQSTAEPTRFMTARGEVGDIALADGSRADLSAQTRLEVSFSRRARDVSLQQGEAYFEVAKDARRPFSVRAGDASVTALGTRFAVREEAGIVRVVVTEGTVRLDTVSQSSRMPSAVLQAGAVATVTHGVVRVESRSVEQASQLLGWRNGELLFRSTPLGEAVAEFNRFNTLQLQIVDPSLTELRIDGGFRADNTEGFVRLLEQMFPLHAVRHANRIELHQQP